MHAVQLSVVVGGGSRSNPVEGVKPWSGLFPSRLLPLLYIIPVCTTALFLSAILVVFNDEFLSSSSKHLLRDKFGGGLRNPSPEEGRWVAVNPEDYYPAQLKQTQPKVPPFRKEVTVRRDILLQEWEEMYGLADPLPPATVSWKKHTHPLQWAPHLEECTEGEAHHQALETGNITQGGYPAWACADNSGVAFCDNPSTPWVRGGAEDNAHLTHRVQRDLWVHQFPSHNCSTPGTRFLVVQWARHQNGIGSQVHLMGTALGTAYASGRILVTDNYDRAGHKGCEAFGRRDRFECYFSRMASEACSTKALSLVQKDKLQPSGDRNIAYNTSEVVFLVDFAFVPRLIDDGARCYNQSRPWGSFSPFELLGAVDSDYDEKKAMVSWWQAQATRFFMRWHSAYLCHLANKARHASWGTLVATQVAKAELHQHQLERGMEGMPLEEGLKGMPRISGTEVMDLHSHDGRQFLRIEDLPSWRFMREPYMPRPIVSVHVRQGDKAVDMKLYEMEAYMWQAYRVQKLVPGAHLIWLSTEMESVIDASLQYKDWTFFYTNVTRQGLGMDNLHFEATHGVDVIVGDSFVNLVIASQCDMFVGVLGSNCNQLINELRLTNGRSQATYVALNNLVW